MKTIGLIGGMSWESTVSYYQIINETVNRQLGGLHSAKIILYSVDFAEIEECQSQGDWHKSAVVLADAAKSLEMAGADFILICTNTMHKIVPEIQAEIGIPIIHIADAAAEQLRKNGVIRAGLLGTKYTMLQNFYKDKINNCGIDVLIPDAKDTDLINKVIFDELCLGNISDTSRREFIRVIDSLKSRGAEAVILGCTEIGMLIRQEDSPLPIFDTTLIHARAAAYMAIEG